MKSMILPYPRHRTLLRSRIAHISLLALFMSQASLTIAETPDSTLVLEWLSPGTLPISKPAFSEKSGMKGKVFDDSELFNAFSYNLESQWPRTGELFSWPGMDPIKWKSIKAGRDGYIEIHTPGQEKLRQGLGLAVSYLKAERYTKIRLTFKSTQPIQVYINHKEVGKATSKGKESAEYITSLSIEAEPGIHMIAVRSIYLGDQEADAWRMQTSYQIIKGDKPQLSNPLDPKRTKDLSFLLEGTRVNGVLPSFDGAYYILQMEETHAGSGRKEEWIEIWKSAGFERVLNYRNMGIRQIAWSPVSYSLLYTTRDNDKTHVWVSSLKDQESKRVLTAKDLESVQWSPDGTALIYSLTEKPEEKKDGVKQIEHMPARWPWYQQRSFLYQLDLKALASRRITWGKETTRLMDIHPNGHHLLISTSKPDFTNRPFNIQTIILLDIKDMKADTLFDTRFSVNASFSPAGDQLLLIGSAMLFEGMGSSLPQGEIPNDYDTQLYLYDISRRKASPLSLDFDPAIHQAVWSKSDGKIYLGVTDRTYKRIYRYDPKNHSYALLPLVPDVITQWQLSTDGAWLGCVGSSLSTPPMAYLLNLKNGKETLVGNPEQAILHNMQFGESFDWNYTLSDSSLLEGRVYLPPAFDLNKKYPVIVHYYGGTSPVDRAFRGRYPKNLLAAHGYIIYVMQPSGATGYGQAFSARHVNNWGRTVAGEIIAGTQAFLRAHPYTDSTRVGCIGASYGGFMTMLLLTETELFATGIAHAGISSISSYWGEGYWGYLYSSAASANSYPWNDPDLYVGQSPLFRADKINTPLLLLHGKDDDNVPPGESIQLFTALKLLGKPVTYIEVEGQGHHVMDYAKRSKWQKTILAWFAKHLQDDPNWWDELYPAP